MPTAAAPTRIASQIGAFFDDALLQRLAVPVHALPPGVVPQVPGDATVLVAAPLDPRTPEPTGWPFGLHWVQLLTSGTDLYPRWMLSAVPVATARGVAAGPIAEYVAAAVLDDAKDLSSLWVHAPAQWRPRALGTVRGSTVGIVGLGAIGQAVARVLVALGARVLALRRSTAASPVDGVSCVPRLEDLLQVADHLVLAAPATPQTRGLIDRAALSRAKPGLHVVNVARGELVDHAALLWALEAGIVRRATLDVTHPEPLPAGHPFYTHPAVRLSPHTSAVGPASRLALADKTAENFRRFAAGEPLLDPYLSVPG